MKLFLLVAILMPTTFARAEVTPGRLRQIYDRAAGATTEAERAAVEVDYRAMVKEATEIAEVHQALMDQSVGIFVVRRVLDDDRLASARLNAKFENGLWLMSVEGRRELYFATEVRQAERSPIIRFGRSDNFFGYTFLETKIDGSLYRVLTDQDFTIAKVLRDEDIDYGREPAESELFVVLERPGDEPKIERVTAVYSENLVRVGLELYDCSENESASAPRAHWLAERESRSGWIEQKGELWEIVTIGHYGGRYVYLDGSEPKFAAEVMRPIADSRLLGRDAIVTKPRRRRRVHTITGHLPNGSIVTENREVITPEHYEVDELGTAAVQLARRGRFERFFDAISYAPKYLVYLTGKSVFGMFARLHVWNARLGAPVLGGDERVLDERKVPTSREKENKKLGQRLVKGPVHDHLARNARFLALKFGAKTYITGPDSHFSQAHVGTDGAMLRVAYPPGASSILTGHETTHVRNVYHQMILGRLVPRTNGFLVTAGAGYEFFEKGFYSDYFTADEAHARSVEVGMALKEIERLGSTEDRPAVDALLRRAWTDLQDGRRFLKKMGEEIELLRNAVRADGGFFSTHQVKGYRLFRIVRPIVRRTVDEEPDRWAWMRVNGSVPPMNRERRVAFAHARLDDLERDNSKISRIFDHLERRLRKFGDPPIKIVWINCGESLETRRVL